MASTVIDSSLFRNMFGTAEMRAVFSDEALVGRYLEAEAALARAEARTGIVPAEAAAAIDAASRTMSIDWEALRRETEIVGYPILPLVRQLATAAGEAGRYVHWGATTQDIMDTATVLQTRAALDLVGRELDALAAVLADLAHRHRDTAMAGRTHLQQALPISFGYKAAVWLAAVERHRERVAQVRPRTLVGQLSGAVGSLASLGEAGLDVQRLFCEELDLAQPAIAWHVARDGLAEAVALLGLITGTLGKIATDVMLMSATEFGEVSEPFVIGRGASSRMPQKRNPISSELILAASKAVRQHVAAMMDAMVQDFERATGPWHLEWLSLPESFILAAGALANTRFMLSGLIVHETRMQTNLNLTQGLVVAEAVMMAAAPALGRQRAHDLVYDACLHATNGGSALADVLLGTPEIVQALGGAEAIRSQCDPTKYLGLCRPIINRVLAGVVLSNEVSEF